MIQIAANLSFVLEYYSGSALSQRKNYALDFAQMSAILGFVSVNADYGRKPAWCTALAREGDAGIGQSIEIKFWLVREPGPIRSLVIRSGTGGMAGDAPDKHARPSLLRVESSDRSWTWPLQDNVEFQAITFDQPFQSEWVRIVIEDAYPGSSWSNICVSD